MVDNDPELDPEHETEFESDIQDITMDFSSLNPNTSNALSLAARQNDVENVKRLLKKRNPNCVDNRGWTCLHEAAANDSYESLMLILEHPDCRPLARSHEGHTALYLACRFKKSLQVIRALLQHVPNIANQGSTEDVTPLHVASGQGRTDCMELLIRYGAQVDAQDFDGDTPLHDAAGSTQPDAIEVLLNAGADSEIRNRANYTPLHLACYKGCFMCVQHLVPYMNSISGLTNEGNSALHLAIVGGDERIIRYLLNNRANPNEKNLLGDLPLTTAVSLGYTEIFKILIEVTCEEYINRDIIQMSCKPNYFNYDITGMLLTRLGPEFFKYYEPFFLQLDNIGEYSLKYTSHAPLNIYFYICEYVYETSHDNFIEYFNAFFKNGLHANASYGDQCPPLVAIHLREHEKCFEDVFKILIEHNCNVDYCSSQTCMTTGVWIPDAFLISLQYDPCTLPIMLPYSALCDPEFLLNFACDNKLANRIPSKVRQTLLAMTGLENTKTSIGSVRNTVFPLKHLARLKIRHVLRTRKNLLTFHNKYFFNDIKRLTLPQILRNYLCYR